MKKKLQIAGRNNMGEEVYLKIKVDEDTLFLLKDFLLEFDSEAIGDIFHNTNSSNYSQFQDEWVFLENEKHNIYGKLIFGTSYIHIFLECKNYDKLNEILDKHLEFMKPIRKN